MSKTTGEELNKTAIYLTDYEVELFTEFQKYRETFFIMKEAGVFNIRNGSIDLHFDSNGTLFTTVAHVTTFKRGQPAIHIIAPL